MAEITTIGILGVGQMGCGIAQVAAEAGRSVLLYDVDQNAREHARNRVAGILRRKLRVDNAAHHSEREMYEGYIQRVLSRITTVDSFERFSDTDFLIEAIIEDMAEKSIMLYELDRVAPPHAIFVTNTSTILIRKLAESVSRKDRFMGMHFMNPPHVLTLLEVVRGPETSDATFAAVMRLAKRLGRNPIFEAPDIRGFATNGQIMSAVNSAARLVARAMKKGISWEKACELVDGTYQACIATGKPMGVLRLADLIGIDTCVAGLREMAKDDGYYRPHPILTRLAKCKHLGRKSGIGFFAYEQRQ